MYVALPPLRPVKPRVHRHCATGVAIPGFLRHWATADEESSSSAGHAVPTASETALGAANHVPALHPVQAPDTGATLKVPATAATQFAQTLEASAAE
jgi:hypothetical protein